MLLWSLEWAPDESPERAQALQAVLTARAKAARDGSASRGFGYHHEDGFCANRRPNNNRFSRSPSGEALYGCMPSNPLLYVLTGLVCTTQTDVWPINHNDSKHVLHASLVCVHEGPIETIRSRLCIASTAKEAWE